MLTKRIPHDILGSIAILKFPRGMGVGEKKKIAGRFLKEHKAVETVLEKTGKISGRLRKAKTKFLAGVNARETEYVENKCRFRFDVDKTYFSSRLAEQRKQVAEEIVKKAKDGQKVLVMFAGVAPFSIVIARTLKQKGKKVEIVSNEINRNANKYAKENVQKNGVSLYVDIVGGDAQKLPEKLKKRFDFIVMPRPNLKNTFLKTAFKLSKKGTIIYYHGFGRGADVLAEIKKDCGKKIGKVRIKKAGEIAPYQYRWLAKFKVVM